jgi:hypothetical protein
MRAKSFMRLFTFAVLVPLTGAIYFHSASRGIFAQANAGGGAVPVW